MSPKSLGFLEVVDFGTRCQKRDYHQRRVSCNGDFHFFGYILRLFGCLRNDAGSQGAAAGIEGVVEFSIPDHTVK